MKKPSHNDLSTLSFIRSAYLIHIVIQTIIPKTIVKFHCWQTEVNVLNRNSMLEKNSKFQVDKKIS